MGSEFKGGLNKADANKLAQSKYGPASFALRVSHPDRNQRFGILIVDDGMVHVLGYGPSYEDAFLKADKEVQEASKKMKSELEAEQTVVSKEQ